LEPLPCIRKIYFSALSPSNMHKTKVSLSVIALVIVLGGGYWYLSNQTAIPAVTAKTPPPVPVTAAKAVNGDIPVLLEVVGRAEAYESVTMKSRLDGQIANVLYTEGQHVKQGDVLVQLDPGDFDARLQQAKANLAKDEAQLAKAQVDVDRYIALRGKGFVSEEKVNEVRTALAAATATATADKAALDLARLQLTYTTLRAPFSGVVGARLVFTGSAVKTNDTALAVVNSVRTLYVTFSVPEKHLPRLRASLARGRMTAAVSIPGSKDQSFDGVVRFIDNAVDATTGTIQMKAVIDNRDERLTPGQFLNVSMRLDTLANAVLIPVEAVQQGPDGNFLFVINAEGKAEPRKITVDATYGRQAAIGKGVAVGETVVVDGQLRLAPGSMVQIKDAGQDTQREPAPTATQARS
jgi:multidrug efflux system membrane fusion protein